MRRITALLVTLALCLSLWGISAAALREGLGLSAKETLSGSCGENLTWSLDTATGVLDITGTGDMVDFDSKDEMPWYKYRYDITAVNIGSGVTSIGHYSFYDCTSLETVYYTGSETEWNKIDIGYDNGNSDLTSANIIYDYVPTSSEQYLNKDGENEDGFPWGIVIAVAAALALIGGGAPFVLVRKMKK